MITEENLIKIIENWPLEDKDDLIVLMNTEDCENAGFDGVDMINGHKLRHSPFVQKGIVYVSKTKVEEL